ncbi:MAG TPA: RIP metalloprotease RseP, partial [Nitrospiraceae bacterium]|nr:RIP metalloprotease RseP [Nitrospiraceae bacterium]
MTDVSTNAPDEFSSKSVSDRATVVLAGPLMNIIVSFLLMPLVFFIGINMPAFLEEPPIVGWVEDGSPASNAG